MKLPKNGNAPQRGPQPLSTPMQAAQPQRQFPFDGLAKEPEVCRFMAFGRSTLRKKLLAKEFPQPIKNANSRGVAWSCAAVRAHVESLLSQGA